MTWASWFSSDWLTAPCNMVTWHSGYLLIYIQFFAVFLYCTFMSHSRVFSVKPNSSTQAWLPHSCSRFSMGSVCFSVLFVCVTLWLLIALKHQGRCICKAEASDYPGVTKQNQMQIRRGRHKGLGSLACFSHCVTALTHRFPKAAFIQFHNIIYGMQMLVLHIGFHSS